MASHKHSVKLGQVVTSVSAEQEFWECLREIAAGKNITVAQLVNAIDLGRQHSNLSSALRIFVIEHYMARSKLLRSSDSECVAKV